MPDLRSALYQEMDEPQARVRFRSEAIGGRITARAGARTIGTGLARPEAGGTGTGRALDRQRRFAADTSRELCTLLAGLRAQLEKARLHPEDTDLAGLLTHTLEDVDRLQAIISGLLLLESIGAEVNRLWERADLSAIVRGEVARRAGQAPHPVRLHLKPDVPIHATRGQIGRVVTNLLDNAQRHARGAVSVEVRARRGHAELIVDDDGEGIAAADRDRVFERFTRLDAARGHDRKGTGLGLAIARDIVQAHGGTIEAGVSPAGGARFAVRLPLTGSCPSHDPCDGDGRARDRIRPAVEDSGVPGTPRSSGRRA